MALETNGPPNQIQVQRLKKRKLWLKDRIAYLEDQITPDIHRLRAQDAAALGCAGRIARYCRALHLTWNAQDAAGPLPACPRRRARRHHHGQPVRLGDHAPCRRDARGAGVAHDARIVSAHRTPDRLIAFAKGAKAEGFKVIIAAQAARRICRA